MTRGAALLVAAPPEDAHAVAVCEWIRSHYDLKIGWMKAGNLVHSELSIEPNRLSQSVLDELGLSKCASLGIWLRRFNTSLRRLDASLEEQNLCRDESRAMTGAVIWSLVESPSVKTTIVDHPAAVAKAEHKLVQLSIAARFTNVPKTIVTNSPVRAAEFMKDRQVVAKAMSGMAFDLPFTGGFEVDLLSSVAESPVLLQELVPTRADVRILVCGDDSLAWLRPRTADQLDWRAHDPHGVDFEPFSLPVAVNITVVNICRSLGITTAVQDWLVDTSGQYHFLECNPQGAFLFLHGASESAVPLFARHLIERSRTDG